MKTKILDLKPESLPPSCLGPDGKFKREREEERRKRLESARQRLREIAQIPNEPNDPPDEEWMRGIDEMRPHRPLFEGCY
ncbi:MAG: hypothetical protein ABSH35_13800 [Isosphaeraceae bacterium]|jgi:hypothetical protein